MILADSSVWIDLFRDVDTREVEHLYGLFGREDVGLGDLILTEVLQGVDEDKEFDRVKRILSQFQCIDIAGGVVALRAAQNCRNLRGRGVTVRKTIDTLIATRCIQDGHSLLFSDRDFVPFVKFLGLKPEI